ncbi:MAG: ABC transporter substrate-binding protein [Ktedonobacteraceae bacterium]
MIKIPPRRLPHLFSLLLLLSLSLVACANSTDAGGAGHYSPVTVRLGYFPNITHAIALVGIARGTFQQALGPDKLDASKTFNAGPILIEALLAGDIDVGYVGPNPAINGYVKSHGEALRIIAGASSAGALFIVRPDAHIQKPQDLHGKLLATPQRGGTQDVSLRHYLQGYGLKSSDQGGDVQVIPTDNPNIITEFKTGQIDGAWVPEPWASRLILEAHGSVFVDERTLWPDKKFATTNVIVRKDFLDQHPDIVKKFLQAHVETTQYIKNDAQEARHIVNDQLKKLTGKPLAASVITQAFQNLDITYDPLAPTLFKLADDAYALGFLGNSKLDLKGILYLNPLNSVLSSKGLATVAAA